MTNTFSVLTVREIQQGIEDGSFSISPATIRSLKADCRVTVQRLGDRLVRIQEAREKQARKSAAMSRFESRLWDSGLMVVAGVDEAGVGPLAGPVVAAAVVFPPRFYLPEVDDSKKLPPGVRLTLNERILAEASSVGIGIATVSEIDSLNVYNASLLAMRRAVDSLSIRPEHLLIDARQIPTLLIPQTGIVKGDQKSFSIAAASIVAKTRRDDIMLDLHSKYPQYGFAQHKGYATSAHRQALRRHGLSPAHRSSFAAVSEFSGSYSDAFYLIQSRIAEAANSKALDAASRHLAESQFQLARDEFLKLRSLLKRKASTCARSPATPGDGSEQRALFPE